jgi:adenine phosphoribosyltransferase
MQRRKRGNNMSYLREAYENASLVFSGKHWTTVNELTDQVPALRPVLLWEATAKLAQIGNYNCDKILVEEDKGVVMGTALALMLNKPLAVARLYSYDIPGNTRINFDSEYMGGNLYLNGVLPEDRITIVDDTISTGGVLVSLINGVRSIGAEIDEVVALIEKIDNKGVERVFKETGVVVKTCMKIRIIDKKVVIVDD